MPARTRYSTTLVLAAFVALALTLTISFVIHGRSSAHTPHPGIDFSMGIDTNGDMVPDCGTGIGQPTKCTAAPSTTMRVLVYLNSFGTLPNYGAFDIRVDYTGVASKNNPDSHYWPGCSFPAMDLTQPGEIAWGCAKGVPPAAQSTYTGLIGTVDFNCTGSGTIALVNGSPPDMFGTDLVTDDLQSHAEGQNIREALTINCSAPPVGGVAIEAQVPAAAPELSTGDPRDRVLGGGALVAVLLATAAGGGMILRARRRAR